MNLQSAGVENKDYANARYHYQVENSHDKNGIYRFREHMKEWQEDCIARTRVIAPEIKMRNMTCRYQPEKMKVQKFIKGESCPDYGNGKGDNSYTARQNTGCRTDAGTHFSMI
jgi:hypothetical protein